MLRCSSFHISAGCSALSVYIENMLGILDSGWSCKNGGRNSHCLLGVEEIIRSPLQLVCSLNIMLLCSTVTAIVSLLQ